MCRLAPAGNTTYTGVDPCLARELLDVVMLLQVLLVPTSDIRHPLKKFCEYLLHG